MRLHWKVIAFVLGALLAVAGGWSVMRPAPAAGPAAPVPAPHPERSRELEALRSETAMLRTALVDLDGRVRAAAPSRAPEREELAATPEPERRAERSEPQPRRADDLRRAQVGALEDRMADEASDTGFEDTLTAELEDAFLRDGFEGVRVGEAACGDSLCRIAFDFDDVLVQEEVLMQLPHFLSWASEGFVTQDEQDPARVVLYATRGGAELPVVE